MPKNKLSAKETEELLNTLKTRFEENMQRHKGLKWDKVHAKLGKSPAKLWTLHQMESTGGEPDVAVFDKKSGEFVFYDCSPESPKERRSLCYDRAALDSRKQHKPKDSAMDMAKKMGVEMLSEEEYRFLQETGSMTSRHPAGYSHLPKSARSAGRSSATGGMTGYLLFTTAQNPTTAPAASEEK